MKRPPNNKFHIKYGWMAWFGWCWSMAPVWSNKSHFLTLVLVVCRLRYQAHSVEGLHWEIFKEHKTQSYLTSKKSENFEKRGKTLQNVGWVISSPTISGKKEIIPPAFQLSLFLNPMFLRSFNTLFPSLKKVPNSNFLNRTLTPTHRQRRSHRKLTKLHRSA